MYEEAAKGASMSTKRIIVDKDAVSRALETLSEDQRKALEDGIQILEADDADALKGLLQSSDVVAACDCGPSGEPGLGRW